MKSYVLYLMIALPLMAQRQELGLLLGGVTSGTQDAVKLSGGTAFQANYGYRLANLGTAAALFGEVHFLANPQRTVQAIPTATRDVASLYVTPGVRVKFLPTSRVSPYGAIGGGWGVYEHSVSLLNGQPNPAPRTVNRGVFSYGGGVDVTVNRWFGLRGEARDFYTGSPVFNVPNLRRRHNVVVSGGFVLRFK
ncbi:MAG: porin family protein [Bryobacteraceae bacterium]|nr:porin family protein [Bryobacteraceae bacterium]